MICTPHQTTCYKGDQVEEDEMNESAERVGETRNACRGLLGELEGKPTWMILA